jgi:hypothetical protein
MTSLWLVLCWFLWTLRACAAARYLLCQHCLVLCLSGGALGRLFLVRCPAGAPMCLHAVSCGFKSTAPPLRSRCDCSLAVLRFCFHACFLFYRQLGSLD